MKILPWLGLSVLVVGAGISFGCSSSDSGGGSGGSGGGIVGGSGGTGAVAGGTGGTGAAGSGGTGGSTPQVKLGRACATDAECGDGLTCLLANSGALDGGGPAKGLCTATCTQDSDCAPFDAKGACLEFTAGSGYCFEGCDFGNPGNTFLPSKCHGRQEMACAPLSSDGQTLTGQACLPQCNADSDCGTGLFCDVSSGLCVASQGTGLSLGAQCQQQDGGASQCKGNCTGIVTSGSTTPLTYTCTESCTLGAVPQCGWSGQSGDTAPGFCLFTSTIIPDPGVGDRGSCAQLCSCNSDCLNPDFICRAFTDSATASALNQKGYCSLKQNEDGGTSVGIPTCGGGGTGGAGGSGGTGGTDAGTGGAPADAAAD
jgi:hypothetical protein